MKDKENNSNKWFLDDETYTIRGDCHNTISEYGTEMMVYHYHIIPKNFNAERTTSIPIGWVMAHDINFGIPTAPNDINLTKINVGSQVMIPCLIRKVMDDFIKRKGKEEGIKTIRTVWIHKSKLYVIDTFINAGFKYHIDINNPYTFVNGPWISLEYKI